MRSLLEQGPVQRPTDRLATSQNPDRRCPAFSPADIAGRLETFVNTGRYGSPTWARTRDLRINRPPQTKDDSRSQLYTTTKSTTCRSIAAGVCCGISPGFLGEWSK